MHLLPRGTLNMVRGNMSCVFLPQLKENKTVRTTRGGTSLSTIHLSPASSLQDEVAALLMYLETITDRGSVPLLKATQGLA